MLEAEERIIATVVSEQDQGQRLDAWLGSRFTYHSRVEWQKLVRNERVLVNRRPCRCSRIIRAGDRVEYLPTAEEGVEPEVDRFYQTIFEDEQIWVVNKPGNLPCHPAGRFFKNTLWYELKMKHRWAAVVNRLDRETSGLVLVAKSADAAAKFAGLFQTGGVRKKYLAIVAGRFHDEYHAAGYLTTDPNGQVRKKRMFIESGNPPPVGSESAETNFRRVATTSNLSIIEAQPATGRRHQIRATLQALGFPLLGDKLYGPDQEYYLRFVNNSLTAADRQDLVLPRQALHAAYLGFCHPFTKKTLEFAIGVPEDMICVYNEIINGPHKP